MTAFGVLIALLKIAASLVSLVAILALLSWEEETGRLSPRWMDRWRRR